MEFTEKEIFLLKLAFKLVDEVVENMRESPYYCDPYMDNDLYDLKQKLGIYDILEG